MQINKKLCVYSFISVICAIFFSISTAYAAPDAKMGADRHVARGLTCQNCHGDDMKNPKFPEEATCVQCHPKAALAEKTKNLPLANPHNAPHNGDCVNCHLQHEPPENYCAQCHKFDFKVK